MSRWIGQLARETDVNVETVRYYERRGLLAQPAAARGRPRQYGDDAVFTIRFIKRMQGLGFTLREIRDLLRGLHNTEVFCERTRDAAEAKIAQLRRDIRRLSSMKRAIETSLADCRRQGGGAACPVWKTAAGALG